MTNRNGQYCGMFYNNANRQIYVGDVWKLANGRFVIRGIEPFTGRVMWESAEFPGTVFRKCGSLDLGYAKEIHYTASY